MVCESCFVLIVNKFIDTISHYFNTWPASFVSRGFFLIKIVPLAWETITTNNSVMGYYFLCLEPCGTIRMGYVYLGEDRKIDPARIAPYDNYCDCRWEITVNVTYVIALTLLSKSVTAKMGLHNISGIQ